MNYAITEPRLNYIDCPHSGGSHRMAYWDWGNAASQQVIVCVHGLSRQGRDFDVLACALVGVDGSGCRVVCPDVAGRGHSDWLADPMGYQLPHYAADMLVLLASLRMEGAQTIDWVGTSMGGLIGLAVASQPGAGLRKLVLNDVGPAIEWEAIERIKTYIGVTTPHFNTEAQAVTAMQQVSQGFGPHSDNDWLALSRPMLRTVRDTGRTRYALHYDKAIGVPFQASTKDTAAQGEAMLWQIYDSLRCPTLLLRGQDSDLLSPKTAKAMQERGPKARLVEFAGVGHAPTLVASDQVAAVRDFLQG